MTAPHGAPDARAAASASPRSRPPWGWWSQIELSSFVPYAAAVFAISLVGGIVPLLRRWSRAELQTLISLSAGIILGVLFLDLLPEISGQTPHFFAAALAGFLLLFVFEKFVVVHPHETEELAGRRSGLAAYLGISLHGLLDGLALGSSALVPALAPAVMFAIVAHKIPDTFSLTSILTFFGYSRRSAFVLLVLFSLLTPLGGLIALWLLRSSPPAALGLPLGVASGTFLFIATSDLLPHTHEHPEGRFRNLVAVLVGIASIALVRAIR